jgi:energy-coupling factor transporter ATP-binding protein EcfA2
MEDDPVLADDPQHEAAGRIDRLEISNFKSYKGDHLIGPFKNFTAIIGPNGSGKSNLMDAISFVLGVRTQQLRGNLKELLYHHSEGGVQERPRRGHVKLVYETEEGSQVSFTRAIQPSSGEPDGACTSVYKINDRTVSWEAYSDKLGSFGILVKVRNFLVFQVRAAAGAGSTHPSCGARCTPWHGAAAHPLGGWLPASGGVAAMPTPPQRHACLSARGRRAACAGRHREGGQPQPRGPDPAV